MWILHISDIHLSAVRVRPVDTEALLVALSHAVSETVTEDEIAVVISGDVTTKGEPTGYGPALRFLKELENALALRTSFYVCPGNHDIVKVPDGDFAAFNHFAFQLTRSDAMLYNAQKSVVRITVKDTDLLLANSAYHGDYTYGLVNISHLRRSINDSANTTRVLIMHHHLIPQDRTDRSTIANAYDLLTLALSGKCAAILHGHRHMQNVLPVGIAGCRVVGVGSLCSQVAQNVNNQFNLIEINAGRLLKAFAFRYVGDMLAHGSVGVFEKEKLLEL